MVLRPYVVRQGDFLAKLALGHGFDADDVWNDAKNDDLRKKRPDPNMLCPGDILYIPKDKPKYVSVNAGETKTFGATVPKCEIQICLKSGDEPLANVACKVVGVDPPLDVQSDGDGNVKFEVPINAVGVQLEVDDPPIVYPIHLGHLDPPDERSGIVMRLAHLGYLPRAFATDEELHGAISLFQERNDLTLTGIIDDDTRSKIVDQHGS